MTFYVWSDFILLSCLYSVYLYSALSFDDILVISNLKGRYISWYWNSPLWNTRFFPITCFWYATRFFFLWCNMILSIPYLDLSVHPFPCSSAYVSWLKTDDVWLEVNFSDWAVRFRWEVAHACTYHDCTLRGFNASGIVLQPLCPKLSQLKMTYLNTWEALYQINWEALNEPTVLGCPKGSKLWPCIYSVWRGFSEKTGLH